MGCILVLVISLKDGWIWVAAEIYPPRQQPMLVTKFSQMIKIDIIISAISADPCQSNTSNSEILQILTDRE